VVEHDEDVMKAADYIIDIGPEAGFWVVNWFCWRFRRIEKRRHFNLEIFNWKIRN
jgi:hypothetical protein